MNMMEISGYWADIQYDPDIEMFRGEFMGLAGGADFYATDIEGLRREGEISLTVFLEMCQQCGVKPRREELGRIELQVSAELYAGITAGAAAAGKSLNQWVIEVIRAAIDGHKPNGD